MQTKIDFLYSIYIIIILGDVMDPIVAASVKRSEQRGVKIINFIYILI